MLKKWLCLLLTLLLTLCMMMPLALGEEGLDKDGITNATGLPITKEKITLRAVWKYAPSADISKMKDVLDWIAEKTNIRIEIDILTEADQVNLLFASGDYPDFAMSIGSSALQRQNAVDAGDLVELTDLIDQYAPTWKTFFEKAELSNKLTLIEGERFTLPWVNFADYDRKLRDCWMINTSWLEELNLEMPTTMEALTEVLRAFKANAGKGTIPENVIPLYIHMGRNNNWVGGEYNLYAQYGVYTSSDQFLIVEDGTVKYQAMNPAIKEPLKWMQQMYKEGIIAPECYTDDWATYLTRRQSNPHGLGSHFAYSNYVPEVLGFLGPLDSGNGTKPLITSQAQIPNNQNAFMMFSNTEYPVAIMRLVEFLVETPENVANTTVGMQGKLWDYDENGKRSQTTFAYAENTMEASGFWNNFVGILWDEYYDTMNITEYIDGATRAIAYYDHYDGNTVPQEMNYVTAPQDVDIEAMINEYYTDIANLQKATFAKWVTTDVDIDTEWDAYVTELERLKVNEWLALKQQGYDKLWQ